jgi:hypothetical protein
MKQNNTASHSGGYVALLAVLIVASVCTVLALEGNMQTSEDLRTEYGHALYTSVLSTTHTCIEDALVTLASDTGYPGGTYEHGDATCEVYAITGSGRFNRSVSVQGTVEGVSIVLQGVVDDLNEIGLTTRISIKTP